MTNNPITTWNPIVTWTVEIANERVVRFEQYRARSADGAHRQARRANPGAEIRDAWPTMEAYEA